MTSTSLVGANYITKAQDRLFLTAYVLLFAVCFTVTIIECAQMSAMEEMSMAGGWSMSMIWMLMPGQTWLEAAALFAVMWIVMMVAMMMPALMPMLRSYRRNIGKVSNGRLAVLTVVVGVGYFLVWLLVGLAVFPLGSWLAALTMQNLVLASAVPFITGLVIASAGALQFTSWKVHQLNCCRNTKNLSLSVADAIPTAWYYGMHLGFRCNLCCAGLTVALLLVGIMNPVAMLLVGIAITAERLVPTTKEAAKIIGVVLISIGFYIMVQTMIN